MVVSKSGVDDARDWAGDAGGGGAGEPKAGELLGGCALCDLLGEAQDGMRGPLSRTSLRDLMEKQDRIERAKNALNPAHTIP